MINLFSKSNQNKYLHFDEVRNNLVNTIFFSAVIFGLIALIASLWRIKDFGWLNVMYVQVTVYVVLLGVYGFRQRISTHVKIIILIAFFFVIGVSGLQSRGIASSGAYWFVAGGVSALYILGNRAGVFFLTLGIIIMIIIGGLTVSGIIKYEFPIHDYLTSPSTWAMEILTLVLISAIIYSASRKLHNYFYSSIDKIKASEEYLRYLMDNTSDGIVLYNTSLEILELNEPFAQLFGEKVSQLRHNKLNNLLIEQVENVEQVSFMGAHQQKIYKLKENIQPGVELEFNNKHVFYKGQDLILSVVRNMTERNKAMRAKLNVIIDTEERERERFAKEIHDGVGPVLSTSKMYLDILKENNFTGEAAVVLKKINESIDDALQGLKEISNNISPHVLKNFGLSEAIQNYIDKHQNNLGVAFHFNTNLNNRLPEKIEVSLYRIVIELINNTFKYANANNIFIQLIFNQPNVTLLFKHDGKGFDYKKTIKEKRGMGLHNINHRVQLFNGQVDIQTAPDENFQIAITLKTDNKAIYE